MIDFVKNDFFSIITAIVAIVALWQTHMQIKISNKQHLFSKRVEKYTLTRNIIKLYESNKELLDYSTNKDDEAIIVDFQFENLTNIGYLKDITGIIYDPKNNEKKTRFLLKLEELEQLANEMRFLFQNKHVNILKEFIMDYKNLLLELYKYQIVLNYMMDNSKKFNNTKTYQELQKEFGEKTYRDKLYKAIEKIEESFEIIINKKIVETIEKEIKI